MSAAGNITDEKLIALAGEGAFERGLGYFEQGRVENWRKKGNTITAQVSGSELYQVTLTHTRQRLEGYCDCPASESFDFCKHCVATALQYREDNSRQAKLEDGSAEQRIEAHLNTFSKQELSQQLLELILDDPEQRQQWSIKADVALNKMDAKQIKKRITAAIPYNKQLYRYAQVRNYFKQVGPVVELLEQQLLQLEAGSGLQLVEYALLRIQRALESIDDSGGFRLDVVAQLQNLHHAVLWRLDWDKSKLVAYLQALDAGPYTDMYPEFPHAYGELLGEEGMALVYNALQAEWDALPPLRPGAGWEQRYPYSRLEHLLRQQAEEAGDTRAIIQLLQKTATEERHFLELCDLCLEVGDWEQVERYLSDARERHRPERHPWNQEYRLERREQRLLVHRGKPEQALELQWRIFQGSLAVEDYTQLLTLAAKSKATEDYGDKAKHWLRQKLAVAEQNQFSTRYADALLEITMAEHNLGLALEVCEQHPVAVGLIAKLARACRDLPEAAIPLYARLVAHEVQGGKNAAYRRGVDWMLEAQELATTEPSKRVFVETLQGVREQFKGKRNFIQFLNEAFH
ncbi:MAG: hypothetical protein O7F73_04755 [Gammaproteobacteria bacterium]|nr:hypothetical protein [Gammaproteobacteria bacterium]